MKPHLSSPFLYMVSGKKVPHLIEIVGRILLKIQLKAVFFSGHPVFSY